jgi:hypothetical protein
MFGVGQSPYMDTDGYRIVRPVAKDMERPFIRAPLGIYFGIPGIEADDPYFGGVGPRRTGCVNCGNCMNKEPTLCAICIRAARSLMSDPSLIGHEVATRLRSQ